MTNNSRLKKERLSSRRLAPCNYLIVCEGKKTEPNYFNGLKEVINKKYGSRIDVLIPKIEIKGTGRNTNDLINYAKKFVNHSNKMYGKVWVVFDKDDYKDEQFDNAINNCEYESCWSNPNFELWLLSHFKKISRYITKDEVLSELDKEFRKNSLGKYNKNDLKIFDKVTRKGNIKDAIINCRYMENINKSPNCYKSNPMTKFYKIVNDFIDYLE